MDSAESRVRLIADLLGSPLPKRRRSRRGRARILLRVLLRILIRILLRISLGHVVERARAPNELGGGSWLAWAIRAASRATWENVLTGFEVRRFQSRVSRQ
jgi:hypothetical protein